MHCIIVLMSLGLCITVHYEYVQYIHYLYLSLLYTVRLGSALTPSGSLGSALTLGPWEVLCETLWL